MAKIGCVTYVIGGILGLAVLGALVPETPTEPVNINESTVSQSDDFEKNKVAFTAIANTLVSQGFCTEAEIAEQGGFVKSVLNYKNEPVYFVYCGGMTNENRLYVNTKTGEFFR